MIVLLNDFFTNYWWVILLCLLVVILVVILIIIFTKKGKKKNKQTVILNDLFIHLGGEDNIISHTLNGSRLTLVLKDYKKIDRDYLSSIGVNKVLSMSNKYILVGENLEQINNEL